MDHSTLDRRTLLGGAGALIAVTFIVAQSPAAAAKGFAVSTAAATDAVLAKLQ